MTVPGLGIRVRGRVQGVGFRPFVWRIARDLKLEGRVRNDGSGVLIEAWGQSSGLDALLNLLRRDCPPMARIEAVETWELKGSSSVDGFQIVPSVQATVLTEIAPDAAACAECIREVNDSRDRRFRYPFANCTQCGPRLSIIREIPYDRARTSMAAFEMCPACRLEYDDPNDRRFHAQPIACKDCGPKAWIETQAGKVACDDPVSEAARRIGDGEIVAVKGLGGYHLACDATQPNVLARLRQRKRRPAKPFALMARDLEQVRRYAELSDEETHLLQSGTGSIVLLQLRDGGQLIGVAPGLTRIGVVLPYTPLHHLLMLEAAGPIVLTSGNFSNEPQAISNDEARSELVNIADAWLVHDREIVTRLDDSVLRSERSGPSILRRARGFAPSPVSVADGFAEGPPVLAMGGDLKSAFCILDRGRALLSPHVGDLANARTYADFRQRVTQFQRLFGIDPKIVAVDRHQGYLSSRWGRALVAETGSQLIEVQHHHAHLASCLAENRIPCEQDLTVGIILDGTGSGLDGTIWGGEILLGGYRDFERKAHFPAVALPGGEQAVREPWRNTIAHLLAAFGSDWRAQVRGTSLSDRLRDKPTGDIEQMIGNGVNSPLATSAGRLFDAVSGALGLCDRQSYEGQAAMELECIAESHVMRAAPYPVGIDEVDGTLVPIWTELWSALLDDLRRGRDAGRISARFHQTLITVHTDMAVRVAEQAGTLRIALSGGVMQNRIIRDALYQELRARGYCVVTQSKVPSNDGGLSLGQAVIAASACQNAS